MDSEKIKKKQKDRQVKDRKRCSIAETVFSSQVRRQIITDLLYYVTVQTSDLLIHVLYTTQFGLEYKPEFTFPIQIIHCQFC